MTNSSNTSSTSNTSDQLEHALTILLNEDKQNSLSEVSTAQLNKNNVKRVNTFCRYSGILLNNTPVLFSTESSTHFAKHWIFSQKYTSLLNYHYESNGFRTHEQMSILALAMILNPITLGNHVELRIPVAFDPIRLRRNYAQIVFVTEKLAGLLPASRDRFLSGLPKFTSKAFKDTNPTLLQSIALGKQLVHYICQIVTRHVYDRLSLTPSNNEWNTESGLIEHELVNLHLEHRTLEQTTIVKHTSTTRQYWEYILDDIQETYDIPACDMTKFKTQLKEPNDLRVLAQLKSLVKGIAETNTVSGIDTIPNIQLQLAVAELAGTIEKIGKFHNGLDLALVPTLPKNTSIKRYVEKDGVTIELDTSITDVLTTPINHDTPEMRVLSSRFAGMASKQKNQLDQVRKDAVDFIVNFNVKKATSTK